MKQTELLRSMINLSSELKTYEYGIHTNKPDNIYQKIFDILIHTSNKNKQALILAMDEIVGVRLTNAYEDGVIAGIDLANSMENILDNPLEVYSAMRKEEREKNNFYYDEVCKLINKYKKHQ